MSIQPEVEADRSTENAWELSVGPDMCRNVQAGLDREWIVTNGLGGYASGSVVGATTRSYHGLLVAALIPPVERDVLVTKIDETIELPDKSVLKPGVNEYRDGTIDPQGYNYLDTFSLEADVPCFRYQLDENLTLEKRVWMEYGQNTTYVQYALSAASAHVANVGPLTLTFNPFCVYRSHHATTHGDSNWHFLVENQGNRCRICAYEEAPACVLVLEPSAQFTSTGNWFWGVKHRRDTERGLPDVEGVAGQNDASLRPNQLFAASLTPSLLTENQMRSILQKVTEPLLTPLGLRSLSPDDPSYCTHYNGNQQQRDGAYHRGTVWQWLIGPYVDVHLSVYKDHTAIRTLLQPLVQHLWDACLGTISEIAEPEPPFTQVGCYAQAWSVAEVLRCWLLV